MALRKHLSEVQPCNNPLAETQCSPVEKDKTQLSLTKKQLETDSKNSFVVLMSSIITIGNPNAFFIQYFHITENTS